VNIKVTDKGIAIRINAPFLFPSGRAALKTGAVGVLDSLAVFLGKVPYPVRIEGHTDSIPINTARFPSNWELSAARAVAVTRALQGGGVAPDRIAAIGCGEYRPLAPNTTPEGRAENRRVEIFLKLEGPRALERGLPLQSEEKRNGG